MYKTLFHIGSLLFLSVILCSCVHRPTPSPIISNRKLTDVDWTVNPTEEQITAVWGQPDDHAGPSSNVYWVYRVGNLEVWMRFKVSPPHHISWIRGGPPCNKAAHDTGHRKLSDFQFSSVVTYEQVAALWGRPDDFGGSGADYFLYKLNKDQVVWLCFEEGYATPHLTGAHLDDLKTGQVKPLY